MLLNYFQPNPKFLNEELTESKARFILYFCFITGAMTCISSVVRFIQYDVPPTSWYFSTLFSLFNIFVPLISFYIGRYQKIILVSMIYGSIILCFRIFDTEGYEGSTIAWLTLIPIIFGLISDEKGLIISTLLTALFLLFLTAYAEPLGLIKEVHETIFSRYIIWSLLIILIGFIIGIFVRQKKARENELHQSLDSLRSTQKLASLGTMAAGVAHQVNNSLMNIMGQFELIRRLKVVDRIEPDIAVRFERHFFRLEENFKKINSIISALLVIGRTRPRESFSACNFIEIIDQAIEYARVRAPNRLVSYNQKMLEGISFFGNEVLLIQMFGNIIANAIDATQDQADPLVHVEISRSQSTIEFNIQNNGPKIDKEIVHAIFDPFFTTKKITDGSGLGLVLSRTIAQLHGGALNYAPVLPLTTFVITLPLDAGE